MPQSFNKIWIQAVWSTKNREPFLHYSIEPTIHKYLSQQLIDSGCPVRIVNGMPDHIHCLFLLNPQKSVAEVIKQIKGSSSFYINKQNFIPTTFAWQAGYAAFSVSESMLDKVFFYIKNQKEHHLKRSFPQEYEEFLNLNGNSE